MGCPGCSSGIGVHNAECRGRVEGILLQQSSMKQNQEGRPPDERTATGPATQCGGSSGSGVQRDDVNSDTVMQTADKKLLEVPDVVMDAGDSCEAQVKRPKTIMGLAVCV